MEHIIKKISGLRIMVLGDIMIDNYIWGDVSRISPEAPVPVLDLRKEEFRLGGAANVATNLKSLDADVQLVGVVGDDSDGDLLSFAIQEENMANSGIMIETERITTSKTRIGTFRQQIVRLDSESTSAICSATEDKLIDYVAINISSCAALIFADYNKGLLTKRVIETCIQLAKNAGCITAVDPKYDNFDAFIGVDIFKPNLQELRRHLKMENASQNEILAAAHGFRSRIKARFLVVTNGADGIYIWEAADKPIHIPALAKEVYDVSGAGDTVISVLTLALSAGADITLAGKLAIHAASVVCGKLGTATLTQAELLDSCHAN